MKRSVLFLWLALLLLSSLAIGTVDASAPVVSDDAEAVVREAIAEETATKAARFVHKTVIIPHDDKKFRGGEDAASTTDDMLVVADGVGGWASRGVNPGLYSRKLTETITGRFGALSPSEKSTVDLKQLVHLSNHEAAAQHLGSATCTVVRLKDSRTLETLNVGDSTYSIHRRDGSNNNELLTVVYAAKPGQKGFNFPYQLGGDHGDQVHDEGICDGPRTHALEENDVIVVVSDGVNDNMDANEYHECIDRYQWNSSSSKTKTTTTNNNASLFDYDENAIVSYSAVADCIARKAYFLGKDPTHHSPFARSAASYGKRFAGGKHDDITVTVAQVAAASSNDDDPHKSESIFVYTDEDGPIPASDTMPSLDSLLTAMLLLQEVETVVVEPEL